MKLSIVVVTNEKKELIDSTLKSVVSQTSFDFNCYIVDRGFYNLNDLTIQNAKVIRVNSNFSFYQSCNTVLPHLDDEYCIFLQAGDCLTNDRVVEEFILNNPNEDIIFLNSIVKTGNNEEYIFIPNKIKASDLTINLIANQQIIFKKSLFNESHIFDDTYSLTAAQILAIEAIFVKQKTYLHINMFFININKVSTDKTELILGINKLMPLYADDFNELSKIKELNSDERNKVLMKFGKSFLFKLIWKIRKFSERNGYFDIKARFQQKRYYKKLIIQDRQKCNRTEQKIYELADNLLIKNNDENDVIVTLTSFGKRVTESAPYAIYTLFTQKRVPNRIILFLDNDNWNENNIPPLLRKLQKSGLEIMFCEDFRPYKKLIPALKLFPNNTIITVDDDVYYNDATISELMDIYDKSDKKTVICHWAFIAEKRNGKFIPYSQWKDNKYWNSKSFFSPVGQDGVLYPGGIFDDEILKSEIFMNLCPNSDDIWFWFQSYRKNINVNIVTKSSKHKNTFVNTVSQWAPTDKSALYYINVFEGKNDINFKNILDYYKIE